MLELKCFDAADKWSGGVVRHVALGAAHRAAQNWPLLAAVRLEAHQLHHGRVGNVIQEILILINL